MTRAHADLLAASAWKLHQSGKLEEAIDLYRQALAVAPDYAEIHNNLGNALRAAGRLGEAATSLARAAELKPDSAGAQTNLGLVLAELGRHHEAAASHGRAISLQPGFALAHNNLGVALLKLERPAEALASFRAAIELQPGQAVFHNNLANALRELERFEEALDNYGIATRLDPRGSDAALSRGIMLMELGRPDEARAAFDAILLEAPRTGEAYFYRAVAAGAPLDPSAIAALEKLATDETATGPRGRDWIHFALGAAHDRHGKYGEAYRHLAAANRLRRRSVAYDEERSRDRLERIKRVFSRDMLAEAGEFGSGSQLPIFIVGAPRSGTTLIEQILASHPGVHGAGEQNYLHKLAVNLRAGGAEFPESVLFLAAGERQKLAERYLGTLRLRHPTAARITDKSLDNFAYVGLIALLLPNAKIIHASRHPMDACLSAFSLPFAGNSQPFTYDLEELGRHHRMYCELMEHWEQVLPANTMLRVRYEELVADLEGGVRRMLAHCGLPWDEQCLRFHEARRPVRTASLIQVRQPIHRASIGRWEHYRQELQPLARALGAFGQDFVVGAKES